MNILYPEVGVCGLSCRLCPTYNTDTPSKCGGCKSSARIAVGCPFITCAVKKQGIEFCWDCKDNNTCEKWSIHREAGKHMDSFKCYQKLEEDISFIQRNGIEAFVEQQKIREQLLKEMLSKYNEGRSKSYYCIAATVLGIDELKSVLDEAEERTRNLEIKEKAKVLHSLLDNISTEKGYLLKLRK